jgi:acetyl esterase/lipase
MGRKKLLSYGGVLAALAIVTGGCLLPDPQGPAPLRYRDAVFASVTKTADLVYGSAPDQNDNPVSLTLDMYEPTGDTVSARPAIVWVHGGSFSSGDKTSPELVDEANVFAKEGFVNVSINYRLVPGGCSFARPTAACLQGIVDAQHDARAAVRWLRANATQYRIDPNRIAIGGSSAGAIISLDVAYNSADVGTSGNPGFPSNVNASQAISGTAIPTSAPMPGAPPVIDFHGTADPLVPYSLAQATINDAHNEGDVAILETFDGAGHVPYVQFRSQILNQTSDLFYLAMNLSHAAQ